MGGGSSVTAYMGIDPGLSGAIAVLWPDGSYSVDDTPVVPVIKGKKRRMQYDIVAMHALLVGLILKMTDYGVAVIEKASPMPKEGVVSSFRSGYGVGIWHALLAVSRLSWREVAPVTWKRAAGLLGSDKNQSRLVAQRIFPLAPLDRVKDHGRAEALLIADTARKLGW